MRHFLKFLFEDCVHFFLSFLFTHHSVSFCPSLYTCILTPPLPLFPLGQQCSSLEVSIIIIQSAPLSTRICQPSTNTGLAINAISTPLLLFCSLLSSSPFCLVLSATFPIYSAHILAPHFLSFLASVPSFTLSHLLYFGLLFCLLVFLPCFPCGPSR